MRSTLHRNIPPGRETFCVYLCVCVYIFVCVFVCGARVCIIIRYFQLPILYSAGDTKERIWRKNGGIILQGKNLIVTLSIEDFT